MPLFYMPDLQGIGEGGKRPFFLSWDFLLFYSPILG